ncbi:MAG: S8 family serine peptidase [bacterium]|nr:S8 family serine peptidase [bacterium]
MRTRIVALFCLLLPALLHAIPDHSFAKDRIWIKLSESFSQTANRAGDGTFTIPTGSFALDAFMAREGIEKLDPLFPFSKVTQSDPLFYKHNLHRHYRIQFKKVFSLSELESLAKRAATLSEIVEAAPIPVYKPCWTPNDWSINDMWGLAAMNVDEAWDHGRTTDSDFIAVTLDTGVDYDHEDLTDNVVANSVEDWNRNGRWDSSWWLPDHQGGDRNLLDDDNNGYIDDVMGWDFVNVTMSSQSRINGEDYDDSDNEPYDFHGHGTHVAGTLAARTNNSRGVPSASRNIKMIPLRVGCAYINSNNDTTSGLYSDYAASAIHYAHNRGARVISMSFGGYNTNNALEDAINWATDHGALCFAAAGNDDTSAVVYPARHANSICVGASDRNYTKAGFSSYGPDVDVSAPGTGIWSTMVNNALHPTNYISWQGTSMAAPNAAAVASWLWTIYPQKSNQEIRWALTHGVRLFPDSLQMGSGVVTMDTSFYLLAKPLRVFWKEGDKLYIGDTAGIRIRTLESNPNRQYRFEIKRAMNNWQWETLQQAAIGSLSGFSIAYPVTYPTDVVMFRISFVDDPAVVDSTFPLIEVARPAQILSNFNSVYWIGDGPIIGSELRRPYSDEYHFQLTHNYGAANTIWTDIHRDYNHEYFRWDPTYPLTDSGRVRVIIPTIPGVGDTCNRTFMIRPYNHVFWPNSGSFRFGETIDLTWESPQTHLVRIQLNRAFPDTNGWVTVADSLVDTGHYDFVVTPLHSTTARFRILNQDNLTLGDTTDNNLIFSDDRVLLSPNGGEFWRIGASQEIRWGSYLPVENQYASIYLNRNYPTGAWESIAHVQNSGSTNWTVTGPATTNARIKIMNAATMRGDTSDASFVIRNSSFQLTDPQNGAAWYIGGWGGVRWTTLSASEGAVRIQLNRNYPSQFWETIIDSTADDGYDSWSVSGTTGSNMRVRIRSRSDTLNCDTLPHNFSILQGWPMVYPNGFETWYVDSTYQIHWGTYSGLGTVHLDLNRNYPTGTWERLFAATANDGYQNWQVTGAITDHARMRVMVTSNPFPGDTSDFDFAIRGFSRISVADTLDLGAGAIGANVTRALWVKNVGADTLRIDSVRWTGTYSVMSPYSRIAPGDSAQFVITWQVATTGQINTFRIYHNSPSDPNPYNVILKGDWYRSFPYWETFSDNNGAPLGWTTQNPDNRLGWASMLDNGNYSRFMPNAAYNYPGERDYLISPRLNSGGVVYPAMQFDVSYGPSSNHDSLRVECSIDNGVTYPYLLFYSGGEQLRTRTTPLIPDTWMTFSATFPQAAYFCNSVRVRFVSISYHGDDLYIDNVVFREGLPQLTISPRYLDFGSVVRGQPGSRQLWFKNPGNANLHVTGITLPIGVTTALQDFAVVMNDSIPITINWLPQTETVLWDSLTIISNAGNSPRITIPVVGLSVMPLDAIQPAGTLQAAATVPGVTLTWNASPSEVSGYHIYRSDSLPFFTPPEGNLLGVTSAATLRYRDSTFSQKAYYRVSAFLRSEFSTFTGDDALNEHGFAVVETPERKAILSGTDRFWATGRRGLLTKYAQSGAALSTQYFTTPAHVNNIVQFCAGTLVITGYQGNGAALIAMMLDSNGSQQWTATKPLSLVSYFYRTGAVRTFDNGLLMVGGSRNGLPNADLLLWKVDRNGADVWTRTHAITASDDDHGVCVAPAIDQGWLVGGGSYSAGSWLVRIDDAGNRTWTRFYGGGAVSHFQCVLPESDGGAALFGYTTALGAANGDAWLVRVNAVGDTLFTRTFNRGGNEYCPAAVKTIDGGYVFLIANSYENTNGDIRLVKINASGVIQWERTFDSGGDDNGRALTLCADGGFLIGGANRSNSTTQSGNAWIIRTDASGFVIMQ